MRDFKEWEQEVLLALQDRPVVEITGVLDQQGFRAARVEKRDDQDVWSMSMSFLAWRVGTDPLRSDCSLNFRRKGPESLFRSLANSITVHTLEEISSSPNSFAVRMPPEAAAPETVIRVRGRVILDGLLNIQGTSAGPEAWLEEFVDHDSSDEELQNYLADLQNPVTLEDKKFGTFTLDRNLGWYTVQTKFQRRKVTLHLSAREQADADAAVRVAHALFGSASAWSKRILGYAADQLLSIKNEDWLDSDESRLTARQFKVKLALESVVVSADENFTFWYSDGDMFGGHGIEISGTLSDGPTDASIQG